MKNFSLQSVKIVKTSSIGDILQSLPVCQYLKRTVPNVKITWVVERRFRDLVDACPLIDTTEVIDSKAWRRGQLGSLKALRKEPADLLFDLQGNSKSGIATLFSRAKHKIGFSLKQTAEWPNALVTNQRFKIPHGLPMREHYLNLVKSYFEDEEDFQAEPILLKPHDLSPIESLLQEPQMRNHQRLMICMGSHWPNKQLDERALQKALQKTSCSLIFIYGNEREKTSAQRLSKAFPGRSLAVGNLSIPQWQHLMTQMDAVLTVDSAALHLAALANIPTLSFFGPSHSSVYNPRGSSHFAIQGICPYQLTFEKRCPRLRSCSTGACIKGISDENILNGLKKIL